MIVMDVSLDNICAFRNFHINFSYPKKIVHSYIEQEHLKGFPNFRYKKVNILMGANASGKTTFGLALMGIFNLLYGNEYALLRRIDDPHKEATFAIELILQSSFLYQIKGRIRAVEDAWESNAKNRISICIKKTQIQSRDRYETCAQRLQDMPDHYLENYGTEIPGSDLGWYFSYPRDILDRKKRLPKDMDNFPMILKKVLMCFDPGIMDVLPSQEVENAYLIKLENKTLVMQDGQFVKDENILSSGTKAGIDIALFIADMSTCAHKFYYCDEKFSYVHSDMEKAFLILMISLLQEDGQLFFTTQNTDILDIPLPKHSFTFMKKAEENGQKRIVAVDASHYLKKNSDSLRNAVDNDLFGMSPSLDKIYELEDVLKAEGETR